MTQSVYEVRDGHANYIQTAVMFLCNLSHTESGQIHLLALGTTHKGVLLENLLGMFQYFKTSSLFDFVANIFANISSYKKGRQWMIENTGTLKTIFAIAEDKDTNPQRTKHLCETIRNVMFEWEEYHKDLQ